MVDRIDGGAPRPAAGTDSAAAPDAVRTGRAVPVETAPAPDDGMITFGSGPDGAPVLALPRNMDADVMATLLYAVQAKQGREQIETAETRVDDKRAERQRKHHEIMDKIRRMHAAEHKGGVGAKVGMAFGWIGVGLAWIAVGVVGVVSGGAAAVPLAVAATAMTALMICQQTGATEKAIAAMNLDETGSMGVQIGLAAAMLVVNIAACFMSGGAAAGGVASGAADVAAASAQTGAAASEAATAGVGTGAAAAEAATASAETVGDAAMAGTAGTEAATAGVDGGAAGAESSATAAGDGAAADDIAGTAARSGRMVRVANRVRVAAALAQAVPQAGGGAAQITTAEFRYEAATARADAQDERADLAKAQEITQEELRRIRKLIEEMQAGAALVIGTIDDSHAATMRIRQTI